uniref:MAGE domain-containing protein n=1 Tax=Castor canadensis TaxID=51338 RepID=A0A8C0VYA4_CASCN
MPHGQKSQQPKLEGNAQAQREAPGLVDAQVPVAEEEGDTGNPCFSSTLLIPSLMREAISLVPSLLLKYQMKEPITKAEMLDYVRRSHQDYFPAVFSRACDCLHLVFGIEMREVDPSSHSYILVTSLGLTYDGLLSDKQGIPKTGLLIITLSIIVVEGNCASEQVFWEGLSMMGVYAGREHYFYGNPRKLITEDFVQEQYLEYRQVPNSDPACYEFLWGPRAYAETSRIEVLKHWAKFSRRVPRFLQSLNDRASRNEEEGAQA